MKTQQKENQAHGKYKHISVILMLICLLSVYVFLQISIYF